jgi:hypothetical protein
MFETGVRREGKIYNLRDNNPIATYIYHLKEINNVQLSMFGGEKSFPQAFINEAIFRAQLQLLIQTSELKCPLEIKRKLIEAIFSEAFHFIDANLCCFLLIVADYLFDFN